MISKPDPEQLERVEQAIAAYQLRADKPTVH